MTTEIQDEITALKTRLTTLETKRDKYEMLRSTEEGSSSSTRFKAEFTNIQTTYDEIYKIKARLRTLEACA